MKKPYRTSRADRKLSKASNDVLGRLIPDMGIRTQRKIEPYSERNFTRKDGGKMADNILSILFSESDPLGPYFHSPQFKELIVNGAENAVNTSPEIRRLLNEKGNPATKDAARKFKRDLAANISETNKISREKGRTEMSSMVLNGIRQFLYERITANFDELKEKVESIYELSKEVLIEENYKQIKELAASELFKRIKNVVQRSDHLISSAVKIFNHPRKDTLEEIRDSLDSYRELFSESEIFIKQIYVLDRMKKRLPYNISKLIRMDKVTIGNLISSVNENHPTLIELDPFIRDVESHGSGTHIDME